jgi:hypothetical protein
MTNKNTILKNCKWCPAMVSLMMLLMVSLVIPLLAGVTPSASASVYSGLFPSDAIQLNFTIAGASSVVLLPSGTTRTILYVLANNYVGGDAYVTDDSNGLLLVDATSTIRQDSRMGHYVTSGQITGHNSAPSGNMTGEIVYVPYNTASVSYSAVHLASTSHDLMLSDVSSKSFLPVFASLTSGDLVIIVLLFALCVLYLFGIFRRHI